MPLRLDYGELRVEECRKTQIFQKPLIEQKSFNQMMVPVIVLTVCSSNSMVYYVALVTVSSMFLTTSVVFQFTITTLRYKNVL